MLKNSRKGNSQLSTEAQWKTGRPPHLWTLSGLKWVHEHKKKVSTFVKVFSVHVVSKILVSEEVNFSLC